MVARLRTIIQLTTILFALHAAALPASHIRLRDDDPSTALPDPDENQDIQSLRDYMQKSIVAYLATQNTQGSAMFVAEQAWRAIIVDTEGLGDDSDSDSAGTDVMTGGDSSASSAGDDVMTGNVDGTNTEGEGLTNQTSKRDFNKDEEVYGREGYSDDDDELLGIALVGGDGVEFNDVGTEDNSFRDTGSVGSRSASSSSVDPGSSSDDDTQVALANNDVYHLFDKASPTSDDHIDYFSDSYIQFTKQIGHIFSGEQASKEQSDQLQRLADLQSTLCTVQLTNVTDKAYYYYEQTRKYADEDTGGRSSQDFKTWASTGYADYKMTYDECQLALADDIFGPFRGPINAALNNITPFDSGQVNVPGVTMMLGSGTGSLTGQGDGGAVPYYALPGAKGMVAAWRNQAQEDSGEMRRRKTGGGDGNIGAGDGKRDEKRSTDDGNAGADAGGVGGGDGEFRVPPGFFSYSSSSTSGSVEGKTDNGGGTVGLQFEYASISVGADTTTSSTSAELKMKSFSIAWQAALLPIQRGTWFDGYRVASLMANLGNADAGESDDEDDKVLYPNATEAFEHWFGTHDSPGPAADYNDIALIIYHPIVAMEFADEKAYQEFHETQASAGVCVLLFFCVGGNGGSSTNKTTFSNTTSTMTYEDLSDNVYYVGSLQGSF